MNALNTSTVVEWWSWYTCVHAALTLRGLE
jgi:hypothetical protein